MKRIVAVILMVLAVFAFSAGAQADHSWGNYHWTKSSSVVSLQVIDSVTSQWDAALLGAVADWSASTVIDLTQTNGSTSSKDRKRCNPSSGKIRVCNQSYGRNGWLGIAEIWLNSSGHIVQGRTKLNDSYHSYSPYNTSAWRNFVTCQEIGHDFGLDHQDETFGNENLGSCMDYTNNPESNQQPNAHDYEQLLSIYNHTDGSSSSSSSSSWNGQHDHGKTHETRVGKDGKYTKVTHITYAVDEGDHH